MKKVLLGVLSIIPIIIVLMVSAVSSIVSVAAYIGIDSIEIECNDGNNSLSFDFNIFGSQIINLYDYVNITILPDKSTNKTIEWSIVDIKYLDVEYEEAYEKYLNGESSIKVLPAVMLVDENGNEVETSTNGLIVVNTYSMFTIRVSSEQHSDSISCSVYGYDIKTINLLDNLSNKESTLMVSEKIKLYPFVTPLDSIIDRFVWSSSDENIAKVDNNGIVSTVGVGIVDIYVSATSYSTKEVVSSSKYHLIVIDNISKYGSSFYTSSSEIKLSDYDIYDAEVVFGGSIIDDVLTITSAKVILNTLKGAIEIIKCDNNEIVIENAKYINSDSDEVVEVGGIPCVLSVINKAIPDRNDNSICDIDDVIWSSSDERIAKVDENGVVTGVSSGIVTITAYYLGEEASIELNVQNKVAYMQLYTSNNYYSKVVGGLAQEFVFASERYIDFNVSEEKEANYTYIIVKGSEDITDLDSLKEFYSSYKFAIVSGGDYAYFDENETNKLIFTSKLEGKGKQEIRVKVSAKYPKYHSIIKYTQEEVTIKAVFGIEVNNIYELITSGSYQFWYANATDNLITVKGDLNFSSNLETEVKTSSHRTYAICLMGDCIYPKDLNDKFYSGRNISSVYLDIAGDLYGNNHLVMSYKSIQTEKHSSLLTIIWSNVTVSNVNVRVNELENGQQISTGADAVDLKGRGIKVTPQDSIHSRLVNTRIEYSLIENADMAVYSWSSDVCVDGCIIRNIPSSAIYAQTSVTNENDEVFIRYSRYTINNIVASNVLTGLIGFSISDYSVDSQSGQNKFDVEDEKNEKIANDYYNAGFVCSLKQTGFIDVYNWQSLDATNFIQTGVQETDDMLRTFIATIMADQRIKEYKYRYKAVDYSNIVCTQYGVSVSGGHVIFEEKSAIIEFEDPRIGNFSLSIFADSADPILATVGKVPGSIYLYKNTSNLTPSSTYIINEKLIDKLHG